MSGTNGQGAGAAGGTSGGTSGGAAAALASGAAASSAGGSTAAGGTVAGGASPAAASDWTTGLDEGTRGFIQNKGWKGTSDVLTSYQNMEKLLGAPAESVLRIPASEEDKAGWDGVFAKLGKPATAAEYNIEVPKEGGDQKFADWAREAFHGANLSDKQAQSLLGKWSEMTTAHKAAATQASQNQSAEQMKALKTEWGQSYDQNVKKGQEAARALGIDGPTIEKLEAAMGFAATMKFMQGLGAKVGEPKFELGGSGSSHPSSPEAAKAAIAMKTKDAAFGKKLASGDADAKAEWQRLHKAAYPGESTIS